MIDSNISIDCIGFLTSLERSFTNRFLASSPSFFFFYIIFSPVIKSQGQFRNSMFAIAVGIIAVIDLSIIVV